MRQMQIFNKNPLDCNTYVYITDEQTLIVDSSGQTEQILQYLHQNHVKKVLLIYTHGHFDHTAYGFALQKGLSDLKISYKTVAPKEDEIYFGREGRQILEDSLKMFDLIEAYPNAQLPQIDSFFSDGETLGFSDFTAIHTPGHTEGSYCLYSEKEKIMFSGDTIFAHGGTGRTDLPGGNTQKLLHSLQRLTAYPSGITIFPGHGPEDFLDRSLKASGAA